ncbi:high mobility group box domain-containing protein [Mariannaea sp. PMI_226]|nr:high mobility group box domain-containing protein [Mariannaea sp. PMI_226]
MSAQLGLVTGGSVLTQDELKAAWEKLETQIHPFGFVLSLEGSFVRKLDENTKFFLAKKFMDHVKEDVIICRDGTGDDRYFVGPPRFFLAGTGMLINHEASGEAIWIKRPSDNLQHALTVPPAIPTKCVKIPRPPNAYILYRGDRHKLLKQAQPWITNNEVSIILGRAWQDEDPAVRMEYKVKAEETKQKLMLAHPDYKYKPRKSSEKKKRKTARTLLIVTDSAQPGSTGPVTTQLAPTEPAVVAESSASATAVTASATQDKSVEA